MLTIYNNLGQLIKLQNIEIDSFVNLEDLAQGIYYYTVKSRDFLQTGKLVKN